MFDTPHFDTLGHFSLLGSFDQIGVVSTLLLIFTLMLADFFDTMGTMTAIGAEAGLLDEDGIPPNTERILVVDSIAAAAGGVGGVSSNTSYIESAAGVGEGARTGLASVVTGVLFLLTILISPLVKVIPSEAAVPALVLVGFLMMQQVTEIDWKDLEIAIPAFLTIVLMPFTYSISVGIGAGFVVLRPDQDLRRQGGAGAPAALGGRRLVRRLLRDPPDHQLADLTEPFCRNPRQGGRAPLRMVGGALSTSSEEGFLQHAVNAVKDHSRRRCGRRARPRGRARRRCASRPGGRHHHDPGASRRPHRPQ